MKNLMETAVKYSKIDETTGKEKTVTEKYLLDAVNFTEAEARMTGEMAKLTRNEFVISGIVRSKLTDVFEYNDGEFWYTCKIGIIDIDGKSGKEKKTINKMLVRADSVEEARERIIEKLEPIVVPYEIDGIDKSKILDVFNYAGLSESDITYQHEKNILMPEGGELRKLID